MQAPHPLRVVGEPSSCQTSACVVLHEHVVMGLGPVETHEQPRHPHLQSSSDSSPRRPQLANGVMLQGGPLRWEARRASRQAGRRRPSGVQPVETVGVGVRRVPVPARRRYRRRPVVLALRAVLSRHRGTAGGAKAKRSTTSRCTAGCSASRPYSSTPLDRAATPPADAGSWTRPTSLSPVPGGTSTGGGSARPGAGRAGLGTARHQRGQPVLRPAARRPRPPRGGGDGSGGAAAGGGRGTRAVCGPQHEAVFEQPDRGVHATGA